MKIVRRPIHALEMSLCAWEDTAFIGAVVSRYWRRMGQLEVYPFEGPVKHWRDFRSHLLHAREQLFDASRFYQEPGPNTPGISLRTRTAPALYGWCRNSRRVFHVDRDLQLILLNTKLGEITWQDVPWPLESFAVTLDEPITGSNDTYQGFLVNAFPDGVPIFRDSLYMAALSTNLLTYKPHDENLRRDVLRLIDAGKGARAQKLIEEDAAVVTTCDFTLKRSDTSHRVTDAIHAVVNERMRREGVEEEEIFNEYSEWNTMARLVVGLCLYLHTLPAGTPHRSDWTPLSKNQRFDPRAITNAAEVCTVTSTTRLTDEERTVFHATSTSEKTPYELSAHFRRGHWRRAPGHGNNPDAPKIVQVRPTLVRRDRLPPGTLPGGTESQVK